MPWISGELSRAAKLHVSIASAQETATPGSRWARPDLDWPQIAYHQLCLDPTFQEYNLKRSLHAKSVKLLSYLSHALDQKSGMTGTKYKLWERCGPTPNKFSDHILENVTVYRIETKQSNNHAFHQCFKQDIVQQHAVNGVPVSKRVRQL